MPPVITTLLYCAAGLGLSWLCAARLMSACRQWECLRPKTPALLRWSWAALIACLALTSVLMVLVALYQLAGRGAEATSVGAVSARMSVDIGLCGYALVWLRGRLRLNWPSFRKRGPLLLPPAPTEDSSAPPDKP